jgi:hypothetical protein
MLLGIPMSQMVGRIVSLRMTGDSRVMKNRIELLNSFRTIEGATYSRARSSSAVDPRHSRFGGWEWSTITGCTSTISIC